MAENFPALAAEDPRTLGPYRLLGVLGAGGMGKVYLAAAPTTRASRGTPTPVAVKVLLPQLSHDAELALRFAREARAARSVRSRRVARVVGWGPESLGTDIGAGGGRPPAGHPRDDGTHAGTGTPWIATQYLAGPTLADALHSHGALPEQQLRALGAELAAALDDIGRAGLIHRDLKPGNVILTATGPRVIDFGIARPEHGLTLTTSGQIPATPGYAAPEQVLGHRTGPAADVFSLGATLARAATARGPFAASDALRVNYRVVYAEPDLDGVPDALADLLRQCLAKDPESRPTAAEVRRRLAPPRPPASWWPGSASRGGTARRADPFWRHGPVASEITGAQRRVRSAMEHFARHGGPRAARLPRRRFIGWAAAGGGLAASAGGGLLLWSRGSGGGAPEGAADGAAREQRPTDAEPLGDFVTGVAPDPYWEAAEAVDEALDAPPAVPVADVVVVAAAEGGIAARSVDGDGQVVWREPRADPAVGYLSGGGAVAGAGAGELLLAVTGDGTLLACRPEDGTERWAVEPGFPVSMLLAADEAMVYLRGGTGQIAAVDLVDGSVSWTTPDAVYPAEQAPDTWRRAPAAAGGGRLLLCTGDSVLALDAADGTELWRHAAAFPSGPLAPSIDAARGVAAVGGGTLTMLALDDGAEQWNLPTQGSAGCGPPTLADDGVYVADHLQLRRHDIEDGSVVWSARASGDVPMPSTEPPVVQGGGVWAVLGGSPPRGVTVRLRELGGAAWSYADGQSGNWRASGAGNRVFLVHQGVLRAMPVP